MGIYLGVDSKVQISHELVRLLTFIDEFKGRWSATHLLAPERLNALKHIATIESIGSSTRIEGVKLTNQEIEKLLGGLKRQSFKTRDEQEVAGYAEAMELIFSSFKDLPMTENHIKQLHSITLKFSTKDQRHRGEYKKFPNNVEAFDPNGKSLGIIFQSTSPFDTPFKMTELVEWTNKELESKMIHPLLVIGVFVIHFLAIHPFQDGNGRVSRILTTLLLLRAGYMYVPYSSLERIVEANKDHYYLALRRGQQTLNKDDAQLNDWLGFFLETLSKQISELDKKISTEQLLEKLPGPSMLILEFLKNHGRASVRELHSATGLNRNTIKVHLRSLVNGKKILASGRGKGTSYSLL
jgi:Fic family protein